MRLRSKVVLGLTLLAFILVPGRAEAAVKGIAVTPAIREVTLGSGVPEVSFTFGVTNTTSAEVRLRLSMLDFGSLNESGGVAFIGRGSNETTSYGLKQWMVLDKETFTLAPGQSEDVRATVANKAALPPGGHYGAVVVTSEQDDDGSNQSVAVLPSTSVLVLLNKTDGQRFGLELDSVKSSHSIVTLPNRVTTRFHNTGNTHVVPRGTVKLQDPSRRIIARGIINESSGYTLPDSYRQYNVDFKSSAKGWLPGRYNVITTWRYDGKTEAVTTVTHVWFIGLIPLIFVALIVFAICMVFVQRRFIRKTSKKAS